MEKEELNNIAKVIADKIPVEKIYCINNHEIETYHLILLLSPIVGVKLAELEPFVKIAINGRKNITFSLYLMSEVKGALKTGNLFFHIACIDNNLIYEKTDTPSLPLPKADELLNLKNEAIKHFKDGLAKTKAFLEGADFYYQKNEPGLTVFMLHQVIELTYRALELAILAKEKKTHNISVHQSFIIPFVPQLGILFPADTAEEKEILRTLNDAYSAVRYEQNHNVKEKYIPILFERVELLQRRSKKVIDNINLVLDEKTDKSSVTEAKCDQNNLTTENLILQQPEHNISQSENQFFSNSNKLKEVITLIIENIATDGVYVFGNTIFQTIRSHLFNQSNNSDSNAIHYDLLVVSSAPNPYSNNILSIVNSLDGITINLFIHSADEVLKKLENQNKFFTTIIQQGHLAYCKTPLFNEVTVRERDDNLTGVRLKEHATRRIFRSAAILKAAELIKDDVFEVTVFMLAHSMEQACLGLIYNFLEYTPSLHNLTHLLSVCKIFWPDNKECFPVQTTLDKRLLSMLSHSNSELRYSLGKSIDPEDLDQLFARCHNFILSAETVHLTTLSPLEIEEYQAVK